MPDLSDQFTVDAAVYERGLAANDRVIVAALEWAKMRVDESLGPERVNELLRCQGELLEACGEYAVATQECSELGQDGKVRVGIDTKKWAVRVFFHRPLKLWQMNAHDAIEVGQLLRERGMKLL